MSSYIWSEPVIRRLFYILLPSPSSTWALTCAAQTSNLPMATAFIVFDPVASIQEQHLPVLSSIGFAMFVFSVVLCVRLLRHQGMHTSIACSKTPPYAIMTMTLMKEKKATRRFSKKGSLYSRLLAMFLLNPAKLFLDVHGLHLCHASGILRWIGLTIIRQCCFLPPGLFLGRESHTRSAIVYVFALAGKALKVVCDVGCIDGGRVPGFHLLPLLFPSRIQ
jgi:hypothetical protein